MKIVYLKTRQTTYFVDMKTDKALEVCFRNINNNFRTFILTSMDSTCLKVTLTVIKAQVRPSVVPVKCII